MYMMEWLSKLHQVLRDKWVYGSSHDYWVLRAALEHI